MKLESLTEIFNNKIFRVPDYQRGYSWGVSQLEDLWRDLEILEEGKNHYTGMLSVKFDEKKDIYYIIDGQQRITTLIILIKVVTDKFKNDEWLNGKEVSDYIKNFLYKKTGNQGEITEMIFGYEVDNPSHIHFKAKILELKNIDDSTPENTLYTKNLTDAKTFFREQVQKLDKAQPEELLKKITINLKFNFYNWKGLRYFLYEYELYLQEQHRGELKVEWEHVNTETIEHIYPQTPDDKSWESEFENDDLLHDLGNLLLLSSSTNSSLKNYSFNVKKDRFSTDSYSAIAISKSENWTPGEILKRRIKMLDFMDKRWDVEISNKVVGLLDKKDEAE